MNSCAKCGACSVVCPVYRVTGREAHTARGKIHLAHLPELPGKGVVFEDIFSKCLLCGACSAVCPRGIDVCREVESARAAFPAVYGAHGYEKYLARKALAHPEILAPLRLLGRAGAEFLSRHLPQESGLRLRLALFQQDVGKMPVQANVTSAVLRQKEALTYFPGCAARFLFPEIATSCHALAATLGTGLHVPDGLSCCGLAALSAGDRREAQNCARKNIAALEQSSGPILLSCASCYVHLLKYADLFADDEPWRIKAEAIGARLVELSSFLDAQLVPACAGRLAGKKKVRVYYHDPCHLRHGLEGQRIIKEPRRVLARIPGLELLELPGGPECCGQGGLFHIGAPEISALIRDRLALKVLALGPDVITSTCSGCLMQWRVAVERAGSKVRVQHLAELPGTLAE
ncbi:MAG: (Fe-S)-binding protein [Desulfobulbaceae bacterium]